MLPQSQRQPAARSAPPLEGWQPHLAAASTEPEVVAVVRDYLATWSPDEIARLPQECRPGRIKDGEDVARFAFELATCHCGAALPDADDELLTRMLVVVSHACTRISEIGASRQRPS